MQYFIVGVENDSDHPISGEIWLDELRLSGVKKETGTAVRLKSKFNLSDLSNSTFSYSRKDADFHVLQERIGTNQTVENFSFTNNLYKSGLIFLVFSSELFNLQSEIFLWFPLRRTSGTLRPFQLLGLVYCGYSNRWF